MGCTASRNIALDGNRDRERFGSRRRLGKSSSFTPMRSSKGNDMHYDYHVVALTSSTYGIMKLLESERVNEHLVSVIGGGGGGGDAKLRKLDTMPAGRERPPKTWSDMAMTRSSRFKLEQLRNDRDDVVAAAEAPPPLREAEPTETINTWELMEGLDDTTPLASPMASTTDLMKDIAAESLEKAASAGRVRTLPRSRSLSAVDGLKALDEGGIVPDLLSGMEFSTNKSFEFLRANNSGPLGRNDLPNGHVMGFPVTESSSEAHSQQSVFRAVSDGSHEEVTDSNLFDPDILATFAEAADERTSSDDDWCHVDGEVSTSASMVDEDSPMLRGRGEVAFGGDSGVADSESGTYGPRKMSFAKVAPLGAEEARLREVEELLERFEARCPPGGQDRVVLYLTSLRGIRKTFEDCHSLRMILQSFAVWVDERDVSMHAEFRQELKSLAGGPVAVPRVFIKGRYIGGSDEVRRLHEDGKLGDLLHDLPVVSFRIACDGCGGVRFVPCPECSGSCKVITDANEVARCPDCNENGLIRCPVCF